jgi:pescadillo protein
VHPVEPKNKKKVNKGSTANRTFYYAKDINYLSHEPIINKFREFKTYVKRLKRAKGRRDVKALGRLRSNKPSYNLDHIVKERYPTFTDAIHDLDDCLSLIFLFAVLPKSKRVYVERVHFCQRLACIGSSFSTFIILLEDL